MAWPIILGHTKYKLAHRHVRGAPASFTISLHFLGGAKQGSLEKTPGRWTALSPPTGGRPSKPPPTGDVHHGGQAFLGWAFFYW